MPACVLYGVLSFENRMSRWIRNSDPPTGRASDRRGVDAVSLKLGFRLAEEQIACGLLKSCGELSVGEAGLAEFAEGFVAGEHEE